jgi:hypothetical protein
MTYKMSNGHFSLSTGRLDISVCPLEDWTFQFVHWKIGHFSLSTGDDWTFQFVHWTIGHFSLSTGRLNISVCPLEGCRGGANPLLVGGGGGGGGV